jgi:guanylate kinase
MLKSGKLFVVSAPSGCGKTTLCRKLLTSYPDLRYSISYTTRKPRFNEVDGVDYIFIEKEDFKNKIDSGFFLEWAIVYGDYYGTSLKYIELCLLKKQDVLLDIDIQGAKAIRSKLKSAVTIFVLPPGLSELEKRLRLRKTESEERMNARLNNVRNEIASYKNYDYFIINDVFELAFKEFESIYVAEHCKIKDIKDIKTIINMED